MMDMNAKPGEIYIGSIMAEYPRACKGKKKGKGNWEKNIKIKAGFVMNNPFFNRPIYFGEYRKYKHLSGSPLWGRTSLIFLLKI